MSEHEETLELMADYALGMASSDEKKLVERHVATCRACLDELKRYQITAEALPEGIILVDPPARLKTNILVAAGVGVAALPGGAGGQTRSRKPAPAAPGGAGWQERFARMWRSLSPAWVLAGLALILLLAVSNAILWGRLNAPVDNSTLRTVHLKGNELAPNGVATLVISMDGEHGTIVVDALPLLGEGQEYQVWLVKDGEWVSGGLFSVSDEGYGAEWVHAPDALASYDSVWLTAEPEGGSPAPTGEIVLGGDI